MPSKPLHPCKKPGCRNLTRTGWCDEHQRFQRSPDYRPSASKRGYNYKWQKARIGFLAKHPWCEDCRKQARYTPATEVDHIIPHKGDQSLFWDRENWQGLCHSCHSRKTAKEDGGFGNKGTPLPSKNR